MHLSSINVSRKNWMTDAITIEFMQEFYLSSARVSGLQRLL